MLLTIIKALEVDFRNADNEKYLRSNINISQTLNRIIAARKHYPEFHSAQTSMFPKLSALSKLTRAEGLCLSYWHDCSEISEFKSALGHRSEIDEAAVLAARPSRFKVASLSRYMQRNEDVVLLGFLSDLAKTNNVKVNGKAFTTQEDRQQITGMLYNLHVLDEQLHSMMTRQIPKIDFAPAGGAAENLAASEFGRNELFLSNSSEPHNIAAHNRETRYSAPIIKARAGSPPPSAAAPLMNSSPVPRITPVRSKNQASNQHANARPKSNFTPPISFDNGPISAPLQATSGAHKIAIDSSGPIDIWYNLAEDPRTPHRFLEWLSENNNEYVAQRARTTLKKQELERASISQLPQPQSISSQIFAS